MNETKKAMLLDVINNYYESEEFDAITMKELERDIEEGYIGLACTTEREWECAWHDVQANYNFNEEQFEYFVDDELIETEPCSLDDFIENFIGDFQELIYPCVRYLNLLYEPLEERAEEILKVPYVEVYPAYDGYFVITYNEKFNKLHEYYVENIEQLKTAPQVL